MVLSFLVSQSPNITMGFIYPLTIKNGPLEKPPVLVKEIIYDIILDFCVPHLDSLHGLFGIVGGWGSEVPCRSQNSGSGKLGYKEHALN